MFIASLILLQVLIFGGLALFLRHLLTRNVTHATSHLTEMIKDNSQKQEEISQKVAQAQKEHDETLKRLHKELAEMKEKAVQEIDQKRDQILEEAHRQSEDVISRAQKTVEEIRADMDRVVQEQAVIAAGGLLGKVLPDDVRRQVHTQWVEALLNEGLSGQERLRVPQDVEAIEVVTAVAFTAEQEKKLRVVLRQKLDRDITLRQVVRPELVAGVVLRLGTLVFDGSFAHKVKEVTRESSG